MPLKRDDTSAAGRRALQTELLVLLQDFEPDPPVLRLILRAQQQGGTNRQAIAAREFTFVEPMRERTPYAGVVAADQATARALRDVTAFVREHAR